jgi:hypothetical protein
MDRKISLTDFPDTEAVGRGKGFFSVTSVSRPALRPTQPPVQWFRGSFPGSKSWPESDADHSPTSSAEVENE